jgi:hypothetical protein
MLFAGEAKREVNDVPGRKGVLDRGYTVSICCVVITKLHGRIRATQRTDYGIICCNDVISVSAYIVRDSQ